ncbi:DUF945 domain-containing protein [Streptomyces sp. NBC_01142]|uniref:DUF932 domain-containing protein n=1 Tax=Streptomyces sp. NBC_01142 TaxID=2975865 RepID=UPI002254F3DB|nr:DUF932 domain-containing protein [Streptomyces sp. NBC_01142]MCX4826619.1 DUF945 domain-containing protein [Streptomyces sp. NBC_01142]
MTVLEIPTNGTALRAPGRKDAWSILGASVSEANTAREALEMADLRDWNVRLMGNVTATEVTIHEDGVSATEVKMPDTRATVRTNPRTNATEYLSAVGRKYTPVQIEAYENVLDLARRESGAVFHKAGAYDNGKKFFISMSLPGTMRIGGVDEHNMHLTLFGSHDGSSANSLHIGPTRLDCGNMQRIIIAGAKHKVSVPHTSSALDKLVTLENELAVLFDWQDAFEREAERMLNTPLAMGQFEKLVTSRDLWPVPTSPTTRTRKNYEQRMTTLRNLFENAATQESIRGTAWAGWNAIGEYLDHYAKANSVSARAARSLSDIGAVTKKKTAAHRQLLALAA